MEQLIPTLLDEGLLGVMCVALGWRVMHLERRRDEQLEKGIEREVKMTLLMERVILFLEGRK